MSTKTLRKRIALVAVSALGFGLVSVVPASAADEQPSAGTVTVAASTNIGATATSGTFLSRTSFSSGVLGGAVTIGATKGMYLYLATAQGAGGSIITAANGGLTACSGTDADSTDAGTASLGVCALAAPSGTFASYTATFGDLAAGTYVLIGDVNGSVDANNVAFGTVKVVDAGKPSYISWTYPSATEVSASAVDFAATFKAKDANGVTTVLVNNEKVVFDVTPQTGATATQVVMATNSDVIDKEDSASATTYAYTATLSGDGGTPSAGTTIAGTTYTISGTLQDGTSAIAAAASTKYTRFSNTSGLTGSVSFRASDDSAAVTSRTAVVSSNASVFRVKALNSEGGPIIGATIAVSVSGSLGTFTNGSQNSGATGLVGSDITFAAGSTAGTGTISATITTGTSSIIGTIPVTVAGTGATAALSSGVSAVNGDGTGWSVDSSTDNAYFAGLTVSTITLTISGLDANKTVALTEVADASSISALSTANAVADANGVATAKLTITSPANGNVVQIGVNGDNANGAEVTLQVTFKNTTPDVTTSPLTGTTTFVSPSSTTNIVATVADKFGAAYTSGAVVTLANTAAPAGVTLADNVVKTAVGGSATLGAVVGATAGTYTFQVTAKDANTNALSTTNTITLVVTATGGPGSLTVSAGSVTTTSGYRVWTSNNGKVSAYDSATDGADNATADAYTLATATAAQIKTATGDYNVITVLVKNDAGTGIDNVSVSVSSKSEGVYVGKTAPTGGTTKLSALAATSASTTGGGTATFYAVATKAGSNTVTFAVGTSTVTATFNSAIQPSTAYARSIAIDKATISAEAGIVTQVTATVTDAFGNLVSGVELSGAITGTAGRFAGGSRSSTITTDATGKAVFEVTANDTEVGTGTLTITGTEGTAAKEFLAGDLSGNLSTLGAATVASQTSAVTITAKVTKSAAELAIDALTAKLAAEKVAADAAAAAAKVAADEKVASDKAASDAAIAAIKAQLDAAAVKAAADKAASDAAIAAAQAAAVEAAQAATDAATEALDAANAATDAANASAEAGDAATAAAQDAADAVAALSTQVSEMISALKKQITALTNLVIKIQKKVKA